MSKGWIVYDDDYAYPIHASSRGMARAVYADDAGIDFRDTLFGVRIKRAREFDDVPFDRWRLLSLGYYDNVECDDCGGMISVGGEYAEAMRAENGDLICDECDRLRNAKETRDD